MGRLKVARSGRNDGGRTKKVAVVNETMSSHDHEVRAPSPPMPLRKQFMGMPAARPVRKRFKGHVEEDLDADDDLMESSGVAEGDTPSPRSSSKTTVTSSVGTEISFATAVGGEASVLDVPNNLCVSESVEDRLGYECCSIDECYDAQCYSSRPDEQVFVMLLSDACCQQRERNTVEDRVLELCTVYFAIFRVVTWPSWLPDASVVSAPL